MYLYAYMYVCVNDVCILKFYILKIKKRKRNHQRSKQYILAWGNSIDRKPDYHWGPMIQHHQSIWQDKAGMGVRSMAQNQVIDSLEC